ncbi:hypothetical protein [Planktotalea sp.]|uniref:hypothetical protein n=1 Tax=Planktotalea sp. TaxID=2029877 RepID=UPI0032986769
MANVENVTTENFLPRFQKTVKTNVGDRFVGNEDQALAAMLGVCFVLGVGMWTAFFMWLF